MKHGTPILGHRYVLMECFEEGPHAWSGPHVWGMRVVTSRTVRLNLAAGDTNRTLVAAWAIYLAEELAAARAYRAGMNGDPSPPCDGDEDEQRRAAFAAVVSELERMTDEEAEAHETVWRAGGHAAVSTWVADLLRPRAFSRLTFLDEFRREKRRQAAARP